MTPEVDIVNTVLNRSALAIAALALATVALTGCTPSGSGGTGTGGGSGGAAPAPTKTYTEQDLVTILNKANTSLQANGTVKDIGLLAAAQSDKTKSLPQRVKDQGGTFTPAECGPLFDKVTNDLLTLGGNNGAYSATLTYGTTVLSATSSAKLGSPADLDKLVASDIDELDSKCPDMSFTFSNNGPSAPFHLTFTKQDVKTAAGLTHAYNEVTTTGASSVHTVSGVAIDGNLVIGFAGISSATTIDDLVKAMNAVYYAAK
ncbi:MAG: hypothetical protein QOD50_2219 [Actinomycetota bacterium]|nr:hypothetical protein [Actinomycetota bacterium]